MSHHLVERKTIPQLTDATYSLEVLNLNRAEDEARTRDLQLGRLSLYQLSYFRDFLNVKNDWLNLIF